MKVKYIGDYYHAAFDKNKTYEVIAIEGDYYRIQDESGDDYLFHKDNFIIAEE